MNKKDIEEQVINDLRDQNAGDTFDFKVPEHLEKKNIAYYSILLDLQTCRKALVKLLELNEEIVQTSLFTSVIILYGKCFTDSSSSKYPKLESTVFDSQETKFGILHSTIMNMRHNFVAHRGETDHEFGKAYFQINPKTMEWGIKVGLQRRHSFEIEDIPDYIELIDFLIDLTIKKYEKVGSKVLKHIFTNSGDKPVNLERVSNSNSELEQYVKKVNLKK